MDKLVAGWRQFSTVRQPFTVWLWITYSAGLVAGSSLPGADVPQFALLGWDKLGHAVAFAGLAVLTVPIAFQNKRWAWLSIGYGSAIGMLTEAVQSFVPSRFFSPWDMLADTVGASAYVLLAAIWLKGWRHEPGCAPPVPGDVISPNLDS